MTDLSCPNCGYPVAPALDAAKMATCAACDTTLFLDGPTIRDAGSSGDMHDAPMLFDVGSTVRAGFVMFDVLGHARFDYGPGWWDEFFAVTRDGDHVWVSVDEGDVILQQPVPDYGCPPITSPPRLGDVVMFKGQAFRVTETDAAKCIAVRGTFPEVLTIDTAYRYVNCQSGDGHTLSGEFSTGAPDWYLGQWLDPFEIDVERPA